VRKRKRERGRRDVFAVEIKRGKKGEGRNIIIMKYRER